MVRPPVLELRGSRRTQRAPHESPSMPRLPRVPPPAPTWGGAGGGRLAAALADPPRPTAARSTAPRATSTAAPAKPIYIYPGLLRVMRQSAIALDARCPAAVYKCAQCAAEAAEAAAAAEGEVESEPRPATPPPPVRRLPAALRPASTRLARAAAAFEPRSPRSFLPGRQRPASARPAARPALCPTPPRVQPVRRCPHQNACAICLEDFHEKDLVRTMPCSEKHVFHTRCILSWISSHDRCPLCNDKVSAHPIKQRVAIRNSSSRPTPSPTRTPANRIRPDDTQRASSGVPVAPSAASRPEPQSMRDLRRAPGSDTVRPDREYQSGPLPRRRRGPRTYSYIVYDSVRMDVDQQH